MNCPFLVARRPSIAGSDRSGSEMPIRKSFLDHSLSITEIQIDGIRLITVSVALGVASETFEGTEYNVLIVLSYSVLRSKTVRLWTGKRPAPETAAPGPLPCVGSPLPSFSLLCPSVPVFLSPFRPFSVYGTSRFLADNVWNFGIWVFRWL